MIRSFEFPTWLAGESRLLRFRIGELRGSFVVRAPAAPGEVGPNGAFAEPDGPLPPE